jgi:choline kinase
MKAVMLAAGLGSRLDRGSGFPPKVLLKFDGISLLERHIRVLKNIGITQLVIGVGYNANLILEEIKRIGAGNFVETVFNPDYELGAITTLWTLRHECASGEPFIMMDGDVLYDRRLLAALLDDPHPNLLLFDHNIEPGEEPVKICLSGGSIVDFGKKPTVAHDTFGEWVGFTKFSAAEGKALVQYAELYISRGDTGQIYEVAIRDRLVDVEPQTYWICDISGLPWIEIDFQADIAAATHEILPNLEALP